jgi:hypothetical protein
MGLRIVSTALQLQRRPSMADPVDRMRAHVTATILHATKLLADLKGFDEALLTLKPALNRMTNDEREGYVARLCGYDEQLPERLTNLVESLADLLAGLTTADAGRAWLEQHTARLENNETIEAA